MKNPNNFNIHDELYWKYQNIVEGILKFIKTNKHIIESMTDGEDDRVMTITLAHLARKAYEIGYNDAIELYEPEELSDEGGKAIEN